MNTWVHIYQYKIEKQTIKYNDQHDLGTPTFSVTETALITTKQLVKWWIGTHYMLGKVTIPCHCLYLCVKKRQTRLRFTCSIPLA